MKRIAASLLATLLLLIPLSARPLALGDIQLKSRLNAPLDARIPLISATASDIESIRVNLASVDQFARAGVERPFLLSGLKFEVVRGKGAPHIHVTSARPIAEPFLNFLLEIDWAKGRALREYTVLLDPPVYGAAVRRTAESTVRTVQAPTRRAAAPSRARTAAAPRASRPAPARPASQAGESYRVRNNDTLWSLAARFRPAGASIQQTMLAMLRLNPEGFENGNVNMMNAGAVLRIPSQFDAEQETRTRALAEVQRQHSAWAEIRRSLGRNVPTATQTASTGTPDAMPQTSADTPTASPSQPTGTSAEAPATSRLKIASGGEAKGGVGTSESDSASISSLRNDLTIAQEETDRVRRESEELGSKLEQAEAVIQELRRLVTVQSDEMSALQQKLGEVDPTAAAAIQAGVETVTAGVEAPSTETAQIPVAPSTESTTGTESMPASTEATVTAPETQTGTAPEMPAGEAGTSESPVMTADGNGTGSETAPMQAGTPETATPSAAMTPVETPVETPTEAPTTSESAPQGGDAMPAPTQADAAMPPASATGPTSFMDKLRGQLDQLPGGTAGILGGSGALLVIVMLIVWLLRRRGSAPEEDELAMPLTADELDSQALSGDVPDSVKEQADAVMSSAAEQVASFDETQSDTVTGAAGSDDDDPLDEVNVYLAYERFEQAEQLVRDAIAKEPENADYKLKLLEVFYSAKDTAAFEQTAAELQAQVGDDSPQMETARKWWSEIEPSGGAGLLAAGAAAVAAAGAAAAALDPFGDDDANDNVAENFVETTTLSPGDGQDDAVDFDLGFEEAVDTEGGVDFDLGFDDSGEVVAGEDTRVDFDLDFTDDEAPASTDLDVDLDDGLDVAAETADDTLGDDLQALADDGAELDFDLGEAADVSDSLGDGDLTGDFGSDVDLPVDLTAETGTPPADTDLDFDLSDFGEDTTADSAEVSLGDSDDLSTSILEPDDASLAAAASELGSELESELDALDDGADTLERTVDPTSTDLDFQLDLGEETDNEPALGMDFDDLADTETPELLDDALTMDLDAPELELDVDDVSDGIAAVDADSDVDMDVLDFDLGVADDDVPSTPAETQIDSLAETTVQPPPGEATPNDELSVDFDLGFDDGDDADDISTLEMANPPAGAPSIEGDLDLGDIGKGAAVAGAAAVAGSIVARAVEQDEEALDFDLDFSEETEQSSMSIDEEFADLFATAEDDVDADDDTMPLDDIEIDVEAEEMSLDIPGSAEDLELDEEFKGLFDEADQLASSELSEASVLEDPDLDLDALLVDEQSATPSGAVAAGLEADEITDLNFDGEEPIIRGPEPELDFEVDQRDAAPPSAVAGTQIDQVQTKLDLAQAYIDMGDVDGALGILDEVVREGNDTQRGEAETLINSLG